VFVCFCKERGIRNLAKNLKDAVEEHNDENRDSENFDKKRRALNMDKLEEIYDQIYISKRDNKLNRMWEGIDIKDTRPYYRVTSNVEG